MMVMVADHIVNYVRYRRSLLILIDSFPYLLLSLPYHMMIYPGDTDEAKGESEF